MGAYETQGFKLDNSGRRVVVDPVTRIEGHMRCEVNLDSNNVIRNAVSTGTIPSLFATTQSSGAVTFRNPSAMFTPRTTRSVFLIQTAISRLMKRFGSSTVFTSSFAALRSLACGFM